MAWIIMSFFKYNNIILWTVDLEKSSAADSSTYYTIQPFKLRIAEVWICGICNKIMIINVLGYEFFAHEDQDQYYS